jgi:hypothetical protein
MALEPEENQRLLIKAVKALFITKTKFAPAIRAQN